ncbi:MAG: hypothetical protein E6Q97_00850 [Desulfurellales bacterium]|nr:MAG: hypothetical protein E6Q97_00850 [Desulfurellales bacterium]
MALATATTWQSGRIATGEYIPVGGQSNWQTLIAAGEVATLDAATLTNPDTQIASTRAPIKLLGGGTNLLVRLKYDVGFALTTNPVIKVFGRTGTDGWMPLVNQAALTLTTLVIDTTNDTSDGTFKYTTVYVSLQAMDLLGCQEIVGGVTTALSGVGTTSNAVVQFKVI